MAKHSKIGASSCERWWNCPGSVGLIETVPPQPESPYAAEGTAAHEMAERCLREQKDATELVGEFSRDEIEFTDEMAEAVQVYLDAIRGDMLEHGLSLEDLQIEHGFHLAHIDKEAFGTNDANLKLFLNKLIVYDYKHGKGKVVEVIGNKQALYYGLGGAQLGDYEEIELVIVQPRAYHPDGSVRRWTVTKAELEVFGEELKMRIDSTRDAMPPLRCGDWCENTFCPALAVCPEVKKKAQMSAMVVFDEGKDIKIPGPETLTPLQLRRLLDAAPLVLAYIDAVKAYAFTRAQAGERIVDYKLVRGKEGNRKWADPEKVEGVLHILGEDRYTKKLKSPAQIEKSLSKDLSKEAKKVWKETIEAMVTRSEGRVILVSEDDSREEVQPNLIAVFDDEIN